MKRSACVYREHWVLSVQMWPVSGRMDAGVGWCPFWMMRVNGWRGEWLEWRRMKKEETWRNKLAGETKSRFLTCYPASARHDVVPIVSSLW